MEVASVTPAAPIRGAEGSGVGGLGDAALGRRLFFFCGLSSFWQ